MSNVGLLYDGSWGDTGRKVGVEYVRPIPGASHHWAVDQLLPGPIRTWRDRVGTGDLVAPSPDSQRPEVYESARKVVRFNGANQRMDMPFPLTGPMTMVVVGRFGSAAINTYMITGGSGPSFNLYIGSGGNFGFFAGATVSSTRPGDTFNHVFIVVYDGANSVLSIDGVEWTGNAGDLIPTTLRMAATSSGYAAMDFQALAFLPYAAGAAEREAIYRQMKADYAL